MTSIWENLRTWDGKFQKRKTLICKFKMSIKCKFSWITQIKEHIYTSYNKITRIFNNWRFVVCLLCNQVRKTNSMNMFSAFIIYFTDRWLNLTCKTCNSDSSSLFDLHLTCETKLQVWSKAESHSEGIAWLIFTQRVESTWTRKNWVVGAQPSSVGYQHNYRTRSTLT